MWCLWGLYKCNVVDGNRTDGWKWACVSADRYSSFDAQHVQISRVQTIYLALDIPKFTDSCGTTDIQFQSHTSVHIVISLLRKRRQLQQGTPQSSPTLEWLEQWWQGKSRDYSLRNGQICCRRSCCSRAEHAKEEMSWPHSISNADESPGTQVSFSGPRRHSLQNGFVFHMPLATAHLPRSDWSRECIWP